MTLFRLLLLAAAIWIVWRLVRRVLPPPDGAAAPPDKAFEEMAACARCGTHVPRAQLSGDGLCARCR